MNEPNPAARTPGEVAFEEYLHSQGIKDFEHEKQVPGKRKRPDYSVLLNGKEFLFEVKDFDPTHIPRIGWSDPCESIREKINEGRKKFKEYKEWPCCLVLYNNNAPLVDLTAFDEVMGAMEGDLGVTFTFDLEAGQSVEGSEREAFLDGGKMIQPRWKEAQNTTISALITVRYVNIGLSRYRKRFREELRTGRPEGTLLSKLSSNDDERHIGVIVWENRFARIAFPREVFRGKYDERWGLNGNVIERIYAGEATALVRGKFAAPINYAVTTRYWG